MDRRTVLRYFLIAAILWLLLWRLYSLIEPITIVEASSVIVHGGLADPMPEIEEHRSDETVGLIARALACECPNEPIKGIIAVAWVIRTRVEQKGLTYEQVIKEPYQFSCFNGGTPEIAVSKSHYETLRWIANGVIKGELDNPLPGATHYYSHCLIAPPFWVYSMTELGTIGCHGFYGEG